MLVPFKSLSSSSPSFKTDSWTCKSSLQTSSSRDGGGCVVVTGDGRTCVGDEEGATLDLKEGKEEEEEWETKANLKILKNNKYNNS